MYWNVKIESGKSFIYKDLREKNEETGLYEDTRKETETVELVPYLQCPVFIENTTFGQFMALLGREVEIMSKIFNGSLYGWPLKKYIDAVANAKTPLEGVEFLEVFKDVEVQGGCLEYSNGFHGWGKWAEDPNAPDDWPSEGGISIWLTYPGELHHIPLVLSRKGGVVTWREGKPPYESHHYNKCTFTLHDVIHAILDELSWGGDPETEHPAEKALDEAKEMMEKRRKEREDEG